MRWFFTILVTVFALCVSAIIASDRYARMGTGFIAHTLCGQVFVTGRPSEAAYADFVAPVPLLGALGWALRTDVDRKKGIVRATLFGTYESRAALRSGEGCLMVYQGQLDPAMSNPPADPSGPNDLESPAAGQLLPDIAGPAPVTPLDNRLKEALDRAFAEQVQGPKLGTKAVVVVHDGRVIAERYEPGYGVNTRLIGFSASKSVTSALIGILVRQGKLRVGQPAPVAAWNDAGDPRRSITIDDLLRMTSGLDWYEMLRGAGPDSGTRMNWTEPDMFAFAASRTLDKQPGTEWKYNTGNTMILSRIIRDEVGGTGQDVRRFAQEELFEPLGMRNTTFTFDATGTPLGGAFFFASARDWARFGMLYLDDGIVGGRRVLPEGWADYSAAPTPGAWVGYGAGFWTNRGDSQGALRRVGRGMPPDSFFASGYFGQMVVIVPSARLVVARFGVSFDGRAVFENVSHLVADILSALRP